MSILNRQALSRSRENGLSWILRQQREDGCFEADFGFRHGVAQAWPTALVANLLSPESGEHKRAVQFLDKCGVQHPAYGKAWGYNDLTAPDCDTTFEVWQALRIEGFIPERDLVFELRQKNGGFATYTELDASAIYPGSSVKGWCAAHLEITANALRLANAMKAIDPHWQELAEIIAEDLANHVRLNGWRAYWYHSPVVAASMVVEAIGSLPQNLPDLPLPTKVSDLPWEVKNNPHIAASAIKLAIDTDPTIYNEVIEYLVKRLIKSQRQDGSWRPTLVLSVPYPDKVDPRWVQHINADYRLPMISVVRVISALSCVEKSETFWECTN